MTDRELMQQALEALELEDMACRYEKDPTPEHIAKAIAALRERLSQPEMQPCAGRNCGSTNPNLHSAECFEDYEKATGMAQEHVIDCPRCGHCCPQSSQSWNELTDEEMKSIQMQSWNNYPEQQVSKFDAWKCQRLTQARLKEKNT